MDQLHELDFCRLCSRRPRTGRFLNILNTKVNRIELRKIILDLLTVNVEESDVLSKIICFRCYRFLVKWLQTKKKLKKTEAILKNNPTVSKNLLAYAKFSAKKKQRLIILQQRLCKKAIENQLLMLNILEKMNELKEEEEETQNPPTSVATGDDTGPIDTNKPGFCICNQVEYGKMIACDNKECPHKWFHYECMNIVDTPKGKWLCNDCVTSSVE